MKDQNNQESAWKIIQLNLKAECICLMLAITIGIIAAFNRNFSDLLFSILKDYLSKERINGLASFFSITSGIYIAVITIVATSVIGVSKDLLGRNLDRPMIHVFTLGLSEGLLTVGVSIFLPREIPYYYLILVTSILVSIISLIKFIRLLILMFEANMNKMTEDIVKKESDEGDILYYLKILSQHKNRDENLK